jgi:two-component system sensor histidine kinase HydH
MKALRFRQVDGSLWPIQDLPANRAFRGEEVRNQELIFENPEGKVMTTLVSSAPIRDSQGEMTAVVTVFEDITELREAEKKLKESERFATIGQTAATVGHDLRNPLQVIIGELSLARERLKKADCANDKEIVEDTLRSIREEALYMNKIVSDLQDYSRPINLGVVETSLHKLVDRVLETLVISDRIEVFNLVPVDLPSVRVDPALMQRVFTNLFRNAVDAMPKGGRLTVDASIGDRSSTVIVSDTGNGISVENLPHLFKPLFTTKAKGQGFGLAVCRRIVEAHNGTISVESEVGKGSTFKIEMLASRADV